MKRLILGALAGGALLLAAPPARAQDDGFKIFGAAAYVAPTSQDHVTISSVKESVKTSKELGWNVGFELRLSKRTGVEVDYLNATEDVDVNGAKLGQVDFSPLSATLDFHLIHTKIVDFYVGPTYSYVNWGKLHLDNGTTATTEKEQAWGASVGLDIGLGKTVALVGGLRYLDLDLNSQGSGGNFKVNPLLTRIGVALRF